MVRTPLKRPVPDIESVGEGPSSSKRFRVAAPASSPVPSDSSPNSARPKRGHKPSKRFGTPEPLTTTRPRPRPIAKDGILRTSLPNTPFSAEKSTFQAQDVSPQKTTTDSNSLPSIAVQRPLAPPTVNASSSKVTATPKKSKNSIHAPSKTPSPKKKQAPLTIFLPSKSALNLSPPMGSALQAVLANETIFAPVAGSSKQKSPRKRKAQEMSDTSPPSSPKKPPKRKKILQRILSETMIELLDSEEEEESNRRSSKPNTPRHLAPPVVIDLCSEEETEPCSIAITTPISRNTTQSRTTVAASTSTRQSPRSRSQTPDGNPLLEAANLSPGHSPTSQPTEIAQLGFPHSDEKEPTIYATSPARNPASDEKELSFYSSSPSPHVESDEKDPVIIIPPSSPRYRSESPKELSPIGAGSIVEDIADDVSDFYVPSPNPDEGRANSLTLFQAQQTPQLEQTPLFLPSESDGEESDTLPTDSQATHIEEAMPHSESVLDPTISRNSEVEVFDANPSDPSLSFEEEPSSTASSTTTAEEQDSPIDHPVVADEAEQHQLSVWNTPGLTGVEGGDAEEEWQAMESLYGDRSPTIPDSDIDLELFPERLQSLSESSGRIEEIHEDNNCLEANAVAQNSVVVGDETLVADTEGVLRPQELTKPRWEEQVEELVEIVSMVKLRMRNIPDIKINVKHAASNGPGTPSVYDPMSMPPLLTPRFFAQSCLSPRQPFTPTQAQDSPPSTVVPSETLISPTAQEMLTLHEEPYEEPTPSESTPPVIEQEQPSVVDQQVVTPANQTHEDESSLNELSPKGEGEIPASQTHEDESSWNELSYKEEGEIPASQSHESSKEEGEISDYSASPSSPPPRIDLAKMIQSSPRKGRDRGLSWKEGSRFGPYPSWMGRGDTFDGVLMKLKSLMEVSHERRAEPSEEQSGTTPETNADQGTLVEDPSPPTTISEAPAQESSVPLVDVPHESTPGDLEDQQVTEGGEAQNQMIHEEEPAPINGMSGAGTLLPEDQNLAVDLRPASVPPIPTPNPITPIIEEESSTSLLTPPSPIPMVEELSTPSVTAPSLVHSVDNEQVTEMNPVEAPTAADIFTEEMFANNPSYYLKIMEESDDLLRTILGKAPSEDNSTTETDPAINTTENPTTSFSTTQHRDSTSSLDSPPPVTPPTIPSSELFFVHPEDIIGFEPNNLDMEPIGVPDYFSDKMTDDIDDDEFLATHVLTYPES